jgi:hypothetical protein
MVHVVLLLDRLTTLRGGVSVFRISTFLITLSGEGFRTEVVNSVRGRSTLRPRKLDQSAALACFAFATIDSMFSPSPFATPVPYDGSAL